MIRSSLMMWRFCISCDLTEALQKAFVFPLGTRDRIISIP